MSPLQPIQNKSISGAVLEQMRSNIINGEWTRGQKIPGELELAQSFGVSRVAVRQAIQQLVGMGFLVIRRGNGTYVTDISPMQYFNYLLPIMAMSEHDLYEIMEMRMVIETGVARLAAERATPKDIGALRNIVEEMVRAKAEDDRDKFTDFDVDFHYGLALCSRNSLLIKNVAMIYDIYRKGMGESVDIVGYDPGIYYHTAILDAMDRKDSKEAEKIMRAHLQNVINQCGPAKREEQAVPEPPQQTE